jgi:hypothetical protein
MSRIFLEYVLFKKKKERKEMAIVLQTNELYMEDMYRTWLSLTELVHKKNQRMQ